MENHFQLHCWLSLLYANLTLYGYYIVIKLFQALKTLKNQTHCVFFTFVVCVSIRCWQFLGRLKPWTIHCLNLPSKNSSSRPTSIKWQPVENPQAQQLQLWKTSIKTLIPYPLWKSEFLELAIIFLKVMTNVYNIVKLPLQTLSARLRFLNLSSVLTSPISGHLLPLNCSTLNSYPVTRKASICMFVF